jgi:uncharacterized phage protein (TIGR02216 family)
MTFSDAAKRLGAQCVLHLRWRPDDFWNATPAELSSILDAVHDQGDAPAGAADMRRLRALFPDKTKGES